MNQQIRDAQNKINQILKDLEYATDCVVDSISLDQLDVTSVNSDRQELIVGVVIELKRNPGHKWCQ